MRVVLTGAGSGIGSEIAALLSARGDELVLLVRDQPRADELHRRFNADCVVADLAEPSTLHGIGRLVPGPVDALVHCAAVVQLGSVRAARLDDWERQLAVNLLAPVIVTREFLPALRASRGTVVFVNSTAGLQAGAMWSAYAASKYGLRALADALRQEEPEIKVTSVFPGRTATPMQASVHQQEGREYDPGRFMSAESAASAIVGVLDLPADATITDLTLRAP